MSHSLSPVYPALLRSCAPALLMASLLLAAPSARAGSYADTQTGGAAPIVTPAADGTGYAYDGHTYVYSAVPGDEFASAMASVSPMATFGTSPYTIQANPNGACITETLTWVADPTLTFDPLPSCVIVEQDSVALWYAITQGGTGSASGTYDCGLPGVTGTPITYNAPLPTDGVSATLYSVKSSPGASFSVSCSPAASFTGVTGTEGSIDGEALVQASAIAYPITINPGGATKDSSGNYDILIGQKCSPLLVGIPLNCTVSNYSWSVSGTTFQSWVADNNSATYTANPNPNTAVYPSWYWDDTDMATETVTCTATVTPPAGQGAPFPITVTQKVNVYVPGWSCSGTGGTMQINSSYDLGNGTDLYLYAGPASGSTTGSGMDWLASVSAPAAPVSFGTGVLEMVQTEIPNSTYVSTTGIGYKRSNNGQQGLDTSYPYPWLQSPAPPSYESNDSPGIDLTVISAASAQLQYQFVACLMYKPPGSSQFVPLATYSWSTPASSTGPISPPGTTPFTKSNAFPSWSQNVGNGTWSWIPQ
jgi:hypothetical protein